MAHYKEWPFKEAEKLLQRLKAKDQREALFETGYGPSGLPHIGTFGEVARTSYVIEALTILDPDLPVTLITFSDDMDGLRSVPENVPEQDMLKQMLGHPLCSIPDPYGEYGSFSENMNNRLKYFLDSFGFRFTFMSASEAYTSGRFNEGLERIMIHHREIIDTFTAMISVEKRALWSPFFPICQRCGRMYTTVVTEHDVDGRAVAYACSREDNPDMPPCGYQGKTRIFDGKVKVGWKVDWALRWFALGIDYEMHGKDLADSVVISNRVMKYLGKRAPLTYKYELFLDEYGKKISKKLGNGVSIEQWLQYAPTDVLMYFMYAKPNQAKSMALTLIPKAIDDYRQKLTEYDGRPDSPIRLIKARDINRGTLTIPASNLEYALICNLVSSLNASDTDMVMEYLCRYDADVDRNRDFFEELVRKAIAYNRDVLAARKRELEIDHRFDASLRRFRDRLAESCREGKPTPDDLQTLCFDITKADDLPAGDWFRYLYQVLLSQDRGPRMGSFIGLYGVDETIAKIDAYLERQSDRE